VTPVEQQVQELLALNKLSKRNKLDKILIRLQEERVHKTVAAQQRAADKLPQEGEVL
jgi:hypothetical protein